MKLTKAQIKRIDDLLIEHDFEYTDIRLELLDHIATDIENNVEDVNHFFKKDGFRTPFLRYMISKQQQFNNEYDNQSKK